MVPLTNSLKHAAASQNFLGDRWCLVLGLPMGTFCHRPSHGWAGGAAKGKCSPEEVPPQTRELLDLLRTAAGGGGGGGCSASVE